MDELDRRIVELLRRNGRMSSSDIGKEIHLSVPAVTERIRKLEQQGVIEQFTVRLNPKALGRYCTVFILVNVQGYEETEQFRRAIIQSEYVLECNHIAGEYDYLLKVALPDIEALEHFISRTLKATYGVIRTNTIFSLSQLKADL
ncbi:Lrp/AsnC family transcriptional regulator [Paenibacillus campi]|uniref:Lrp/AsnC family transcriptional regulator n=1 Tax=Paenibacillus campi TaxID=3106031 RepID=UPI002AFE7018|nr:MULTISPECIES: Lrp/AsnC family transcriptional regulator [unclassified Paenibacillus]